MIRRSFVVIGIVSVLLLALFSVVYAQDAGPQAVDAPQAVLGTAFTYQGQLKSGGAGVSGSCDMAFRLYDAATVGNPVGVPLTQTVAVNEGFFTAQLDFGASAFNGQARWLEITVKCASDAAFTTLSRQALTAAPYAVYAQNVNTTTVQSRVTGVCGAGFAVRQINVDGSVTCEPVTGSSAHDHWGASWSGTGTGLTLTGGSTGLAASGSTYGIYGNASATTGTNYGVYGQVASPNGWAGSFDTSVGNGVYITAPNGTGLNVASGAALVAGNVIWHAGNDGPTSGLNADLLEGQHGSYYRDASNIQAGTLSTSNYSAYGDLSAEGYLDNNASADLLTRVQNDGRYWMLGGNTVTTDAVLGTTSNNALDVRVNNQRTLRLEPNVASPNVIGGHSGNDVTGSVYGATIGGGGNSGSTNQVSGNYGTVGGGASNIASRPYATVPGGYGATADHYGQMAYASGSYTTMDGGVAQTSLYVMRNQYSGASWHDLYLNGENESERLTIASFHTLAFDILIVGLSTDTQSAGYHIQGVINNYAGTTTFVGTPTVTNLGEDVAAWDARVLADNTNDALSVQVINNGATVRWVATVRTSEVAW